jgi:hypothetical protein
MNDTKLIVAFAFLHLVALAAGGGLLLLAIRGGDEHERLHGQGGWDGYRSPDPPRRPTGSPPLPVAASARVRLREPGRLADLVPPMRRRESRERDRPAPIHLHRTAPPNPRQRS